MKSAAGTKFVCHVGHIQLTQDGTFKGKIDIQEIIENHVLSSEEKSGLVLLILELLK